MKIYFNFLIALTTLVCLSFTPLCTKINASSLPDYAHKSSWVHQTTTPSKEIDVFYVYPTIYTEQSPANLDINNPQLRNTATHLLHAQAAVYSKTTNLFSPYYRQMSLGRLNPDEDMYKNQYYLIGYNDVATAFEYYLKHLNNGRPFILAGHSQGSMILSNLMRDYFDDVKLLKQLVATYLIGYSITNEDFQTYPWIKPATKMTTTLA